MPDSSSEEDEIDPVTGLKRSERAIVEKVIFRWQKLMLARKRKVQKQPAAPENPFDANNSDARDEQGKDDLIEAHAQLRTFPSTTSMSSGATSRVPKPPPVAGDTPKSRKERTKRTASERAAIASRQALLRCDESLSMYSLQQELIQIERKRRRSGRRRAVMPGEAKEIQHVVDDQFDLNSLEQRIETSVTASVVGKGSARVVEMFKLSCESTMQHLFGVAAKMTGNGVAWFEQGKSWEGKGTSRAEALRGVQVGMFNLQGVSPIAALRIAASANQGSHEAFPFRRQGPINRSRMTWTL
jgi:hypothetical protein